MINNIKMKIIIYFLVTLVSMYFFVIDPNVGISLLLFSSIQAYLLYWLTNNKKVVLYYIPNLILAAGASITSFEGFSIFSIFLSAVLYNVITLALTDKLNLNVSLFEFVKNLFINGFKSIGTLFLPLLWINESLQKGQKRFRKILLGALFSLPVVIILVALLGSADMIFAETLSRFFGNLIHWNIDELIAVKIVFSFIFSSYLMGVVISLLQPTEKKEIITKTPKIQSDSVINTVLCSALIVYILFVIVQIKYLFAGNTLPYGLNYAEYARKGFFELLLLSFINITMILSSVYLTKTKSGKLVRFNRILLNCLNGISIVLLASSFYRMYLYTADYGLTKLRLFVFVFLVVELVALLITFFYIQKPKFNVLFIYCCLVTAYYITMTIMPVDAFIARSLVDNYLSGKQANIDYVFDYLSLDAAEEVVRLKDDPKYAISVEQFFCYQTDKLEEDSWMSLNLYRTKAVQVVKQHNIEYKNCNALGGD